MCPSIPGGVDASALPPLHITSVCLPFPASHAMHLFTFLVPYPCLPFLPPFLSSRCLLSLMFLPGSFPFSSLEGVGRVYGMLRAYIVLCPPLPAPAPVSLHSSGIWIRSSVFVGLTVVIDRPRYMRSNRPHLYAMHCDAS